MTGRDVLTAALRLIGATAPGESLAASEATDGLAVLNRMVDSWSTEELLIYARTRETPYTLTPGTATVTIGSGGNIAVARPIWIDSAMIQDASTSIESPLKLLTQEEYGAIPYKTQQSTYPTMVYDDGGYPTRTLTLYPVPSAAHKLVLYTLRPLTTIATLDTALSLPPGYERALISNVAIELAPEYGKAASAELMAQAMESKANIKRANHRSTALRCDEALTGRGFFNIYTGGYTR